MLVVEASKEHHQQLIGMVALDNETPLKGALVEVFDNPDYLLKGFDQSKPPKQERLRACITGVDGKFRIRNLPSGRYEMRASLDPGMDVTHIYVVIDRENGSKEPMVVRLQLGT